MLSFLNRIGVAHSIAEVETGTVFYFLDANAPLLHVYKFGRLWLDAAGTLLRQEFKLIYHEFTDRTPFLPLQTITLKKDDGI